MNLYYENHRIILRKYPVIFIMITKITDYENVQSNIFILSFDFRQNKLRLYHNNNIADDIDIKDYNEIIPAFSMYDAGDKLEITKWQFI